MSSRLVITDAIRQLTSRIISAAFGFITIKIMTPYLGPLRYGDYSNILKYFAFWTALADLGLYVLAVKRLGELKAKGDMHLLQEEYGKFVGTRIVTMAVIYLIAIAVAYCIPTYRENPYILRGLPLGMLFSASFMYAGIQQLPLQLFWKMKHLSISLITARISQLAILIPTVYLIFKEVNFNEPSRTSIRAFLMILVSVVASAIGQNIEIGIRSRKILPLNILFDRTFIRRTIKHNWNYGVSYYLSSFHTLMPLLFLGRYFPTMSGHDYNGIWALSLSLIEILLIIPSALGNSLLHKIAAYKTEHKRKSIGNLLTIIARIGAIIALNFTLFSDRIIKIVSGKAFLGTFDTLQTRGSNQVLPFLGIVLFLSFIKQVYNYLFVATEKQNVLLGINGVGVIVGLIISIRIIPQYALRGATISQLSMELLFMGGAIRVARKNQISPIISPIKCVGLLTTLIGIGAITYGIIQKTGNTLPVFVIAVLLMNALIFIISYKAIKQTARGLTIEEGLTVEEEKIM